MSNPHEVSEPGGGTGGREIKESEMTGPKDTAFDT